MLLLLMMMMMIMMKSILPTLAEVNPECECVLYESVLRSHGVFTSPNFPANYHSNIDCILYSFAGDADEIVELTFTAFDLQLSFKNKCFDYLRFYVDLDRTAINERFRGDYELCGDLSFIRTKHYSSTGNLVLEFHSDAISSNSSGFKGLYSFLPKSKYQIEGGSRRWGTQCAYDFYSTRHTKSARFFSPRFPQNYPPFANCQYVFYALPTERVRVTFHLIELEQTDSSCSDSGDSIVVRDGADASANVIAQLCNSLSYEQVLSSSEHLYIDFLVDGKNQRQGFEARAAFIASDQIRPDIRLNNIALGPDLLQSSAASDSECNEEFVSNAKSEGGSFSSPSYPLPHPADVTCRYVFQSKGEERIQLVFDEIDLNDPNHREQKNNNNSSHCDDVDSITVAVYIDGRPSDIGVFCGRTEAPMLMSSGQTMEVTFVSRTTTNRPTAKGFSARFTFVKACGFVFRSDAASNGTFTSPNFPGLYPRNTECHYLFFGKEAEIVFIRFPYFDVEGVPPCRNKDSKDDYVELSNFSINLTERRTDRVCGAKRSPSSSSSSSSSSHRPDPSFTSDGHFFRVTFKSNNALDARGFEAFYQFRSIIEDPYSPSKTRDSSGVRAVNVDSRKDVGFLLLLLVVVITFLLRSN